VLLEYAITVHANPPAQLMDQVITSLKAVTVALTLSVHLILVSIIHASITNALKLCFTLGSFLTNAHAILVQTVLLKTVH
jgi:hypothetical protein